jgi:hypothetical protein
MTDMIGSRASNAARKGHGWAHRLIATTDYD